jgi:hypothetical protein
MPNIQAAAEMRRCGFQGDDVHDQQESSSHTGIQILSSQQYKCRARCSASATPPAVGRSAELAVIGPRPGRKTFSRTSQACGQRIRRSAPGANQGGGSKPPPMSAVGRAGKAAKPQTTWAPAGTWFLLCVLCHGPGRRFEEGGPGAVYRPALCRSEPAQELDQFLLFS